MDLRRIVPTVALVVALSISRAPAQCVGDCHNDNEVTVDELLMMVNIALDNAPMSTCDVGDADHDGTITVDEVIIGVNHAMLGCPAPVSPDLEKAAGVATSTLVALFTALTELPVLESGDMAAALAAPALTRRVIAGLEVGARFRPQASEPCDGGGTMNVSCRESGGNSILTAVLANCRVPDEETGGMVTSSGTLVGTVASLGVCSTGVIPSNVRLTTDFTNFTSQYADAGGTVVGNLSLPNFTESIDPTGQGCAGPNGTLSLSGSYTTSIVAVSVDLSVAANNLSLQVASSGTPCALEMTATGSLEVGDHANDRQFTVSFSNSHVTFGSEESMDGALDGSMGVSCIGHVAFQTDMPIRIGGGGCASAGRLSVTLASGTNGRIDFTAAGGVAFDYDADGSADKVVAECHDASVTQCRGA